MPMDVRFSKQQAEERWLDREADPPPPQARKSLIEPEAIVVCGSGRAGRQPDTVRSLTDR